MPPAWLVDGCNPWSRPAHYVQSGKLRKLKPGPRRSARRWLGEDPHSGRCHSQGPPHLLAPWDHLGVADTPPSNGPALHKFCSESCWSLPRVHLCHSWTGLCAIPWRTLFACAWWARNRAICDGRWCAAALLGTSPRHSVSLESPASYLRNLVQTAALSKRLRRLGWPSPQCALPWGCPLHPQKRGRCSERSPLPRLGSWRPHPAPQGWLDKSSVWVLLRWKAPWWIVSSWTSRSVSGP